MRLDKDRVVRPDRSPPVEPRTANKTHEAKVELLAILELAEVDQFRADAELRLVLYQLDVHTVVACRWRTEATQHLIPLSKIQILDGVAVVYNLRRLILLA